jgi:general secretion pathway protein K
VTVLWTIALLSALALAASATFRGFSGIVALDSDRARAEGLLNAGVEVAAAMLAGLGQEQQLTNRETTFSLSTGSVHLRLVDAGGRIDVNKAPIKILASLLRSVGAADDAEIIAQSIDCSASARVRQIWRVEEERVSGSL